MLETTTSCVCAPFVGRKDSRCFWSPNLLLLGSRLTIAGLATSVVVGLLLFLATAAALVARSQGFHVKEILVENVVQVVLVAAVNAQKVIERVGRELVVVPQQEAGGFAVVVVTLRGRRLEGCGFGGLSHELRQQRVKTVGAPGMREVPEMMVVLGRRSRRRQEQEFHPRQLGLPFFKVFLRKVESARAALFVPVPPLGLAKAVLQVLHQGHVCNGASLKGGAVLPAHTVGKDGFVHGNNGGRGE